MKSISCLYDSHNESYILCHSALLTFIVTIMIPMNFQLTKLPPVAALLLFSVGFLSLFSIVRNEMVGCNLLKFLSVGERLWLNRSSEPQFKVQSKRDSISSHKVTDSDPTVVKNCDDLIGLLQNFVNELATTHEQKMDRTTLDSFSKLRARLLEISQVEI